MVLFYDSKLKKKVKFEPLVDGKVSFYVCGPTVYDLAHVGHGRSAVAFDVIRRYFEYKGYDVNFVSNFTDIDDKMITRAARDGITVSELADKIIPEYIADYTALGVRPPTLQPRATDYIDEMLDLIAVLFKKGFAYVIDGDGVYFDVCKFKKYGELSGQKLKDLQVGCRIDLNNAKNNPYDFALWKFKKDGEPFWPSEWGDGRPGWHIECSAMTKSCLGKKFDFHGGGRDLIFPHHECEIAQSVCAYGKGSFAQNWVHNGFINVDNEKMSKSLGNFFTLREVCEKFSPRAVRFMFLQTHYRKPINFSDKVLEQAEAALRRIDAFVRRLDNAGIDDGEKLNEEVVVRFKTFEDAFVLRMDDDFDTSGALGVLFDFIRDINVLFDKGLLSNNDLLYISENLRRIDLVFGVIFFVNDLVTDDDAVEKLVNDRQKARADKNYILADEIRDRLTDLGVVIEDGANGTTWHLE